MASVRLQVCADPAAKTVLVVLPEGPPLELSPDLAIDLGWGLIDVAVRTAQ